MPMTAGVDNLNARYGGIHNFCIGHRAYHMIGLDRMPEGMRPTFLQLYIHDQDKLNDRMAMKVAERLDRSAASPLVTLKSSYCAECWFMTSAESKRQSDRSDFKHMFPGMICRAW